MLISDFPLFLFCNEHIICIAEYIIYVQCTSSTNASWTYAGQDVRDKSCRVFGVGLLQSEGEVNVLCPVIYTLTYTHTHTHTHTYTLTHMQTHTHVRACTHMIRGCWPICYAENIVKGLLREKMATVQYNFILLHVHTYAGVHRPHIEAALRKYVYILEHTPTQTPPPHIPSSTHTLTH